jgi:hypothetical protein
MYKGSAKGRGVEFLLSRDQFEAFWQQPCFYCEAEIATIGLDRIDSRQGYIVDNVRPCCTDCNTMKFALPVDVFLEKCRAIAARFPNP